MKKLLFVVSLLLAGQIFAEAPADEPIPLVKAGSNPTAIHIQRTMKALEASTAEHPARVRVLFYGQSIVAQGWTEQVQRELQRRYPTVIFRFVKKAIGGFESPNLRHTAKTDLYPFYPDLLFFHDYGPLQYYEEMVRLTKQTTTADVVLWSSHLDSSQDPAAMLANRNERTRGIEAIAKRWHCMYIDLNRKWSQLLLDQHLATTNLLRDGVHMNPTGCGYYARFIAEELVRLPGTAGLEADSGVIREIPLTAPEVKRRADGGWEVSFTGNRLVAVSDGTGTAEVQARVLLDGQPIENDMAQWITTRPTTWPIWMPAIRHVDFKTLPVQEEWNLTSLEGSATNGVPVHFKLEGSRTGFDGEGWSTNLFVSKSGRAIIHPDDWGFPFQLNYAHQQLKPGRVFSWRTEPTFQLPFTARPAGERIVLAQGCASGRHTLTIFPLRGSLGIGSFISYQPPICND